MAWVRGQERYVYEEVNARLKSGLLSGMGWDGSLLNGGLPFGAHTPLTFVESLPDIGGTAVVPNSIALSEGDLPDDVEQELGGHLVAVTHTFFVDIYGEDPSISRAIAGDVRAIFTGRVPGLSRSIVLTDWTQPARPPLPGHLLHFEDVEVTRPANQGVGRTTWTVVKFTAVHEHS